MKAKMFFHARESFGFKIVTAFIAVIVLVLSAFTGFAVFREGEKTKQNLTEQGEMLAILLAHTSTIGVFAENRTLLGESTAGIIILREVSSVFVYNADGKILYAKEKKSRSESLVLSKEYLEGLNAGAGPVHIREAADSFEFVRPVLIRTLSENDETLYLGHQAGPASEKVIGYVRIVLNKDSYRKEIVSILIRNGFIMLIFIFSSIGIVLAIVRKATNPLKKLTDNVMALGQGMPVEQIPVTSRDEIGKLASAFNTMVSARSSAEKSLRESEKKFRMLAETAAAAIFIYRGESFLYLNSTMEKLTGYSRDEIMAMNIWTIVHPDFQPLMKELIASDGQHAGEPFRCEFKILTRTGEERWVDFTFGVIEFEGKPAVLGTAYDLTPRKKMEAQFLQARKMEAVGVLAGGIAHDFNNYISTIITYAYSAKKNSPKTDPLVFIDHILACSEHAANLTKGLLTFSRKQTISPKPVRVGGMVAGIEKFISSVLGEGIALKMSLAGQDMVILADPGQLEQVFMNLAANARDAMPRGGTFSIGSEAVDLDDAFIMTNGYGIRGKYALLTVTDSGAGIDNKTLERIFEPFFTTKAAGKGTGLGLSIVYGIVKQHNGYIVASSEPGSGTSFKIYFPLIQPPTRSTEPPQSSIPARGTETILLAEDNNSLRELTAMLLSESGYTVIPVENGEQALAKFSEKGDQISLLILDVMMPGKNGQEVLMEIRKIRQDVKVLFVTGRTDNVWTNADMIARGLHVLTKPILPAALMEKIREILDA